MRLQVIITFEVDPMVPLNDEQILEFAKQTTVSLAKVEHALRPKLKSITEAWSVIRD